VIHCSFVEDTEKEKKMYGLKYGGLKEFSKALYNTACGFS